MSDPDKLMLANNIILIQSSPKGARCKNTRLTLWAKSMALMAVTLMLAASSGCSTLSTLGLPFGGTSNKLLESAKDISDAPGLPIAVPKELLKQPIETYIVEISDTIFVEAVNFDATIRLPGDQTVKPDGTISIGEFGTYSAVNKTIDQIQREVQMIIDDRSRMELEVEYQQELRRAEEDRNQQALSLDQTNPNGMLDSSDTQREQILAENRRRELERRIEERIRQNQISVRLVNWDSKRIYVLGEINSPGFYGFTGNQTVLDAIVEAGGLTSKANHHQIIVSRPTPGGSCRIVMQVCYDQVVQLGDTSTNYQLLPGDRVFVPGLTFADDLKKTFRLNQDDRCPRCAPCQQGCDLPVGN